MYIPIGSGGRKKPPHADTTPQSSSFADKNEEVLSDKVVNLPMENLYG